MPIILNNKIVKFYCGNIEQKLYLGNTLLTSVKVTYIYGNNIVKTEYVQYGSLVSDYVPEAVSGRTFLGWTINKNGTTTETVYATGDTVLYGIGKVSGSASQSVSLRTIDRYEDGNFVGSYADTSFSVSSSVPLNTLVKVTIQVWSDEWGIYAGVNVGGVGVSVNAQNGTGSNLTTGKLANRNGFASLSCSEGTVERYISIYYSWQQIIVG